MGLDGALAEVELVGDLAVGQALADVDENFPLAVGQPVELAVGDIGGLLPVLVARANSRMRRRVKRPGICAALILAAPRG